MRVLCNLQVRSAVSGERKISKCTFAKEFLWSFSFLQVLFMQGNALFCLFGMRKMQLYNLSQKRHYQFICTNIYRVVIFYSLLFVQYFYIRGAILAQTISLSRQCSPLTRWHDSFKSSWHTFVGSIWYKQNSSACHPP